jgi:hypothetical protein
MAMRFRSFDGSRHAELWARRSAVVLCLLLVPALFCLLVSFALASSFGDVPTDHPYYVAISDLSSRGIISGYADGSFGPNKQVLRKHFAKMIVGSVGLVPTEADWSDADPPFTDCGRDNPNDLYPHDYIAVAKEYGLTAGKTLTKFAPEANITRAQLFTMVVRAAQNFGVNLKPVPADYAAWSVLVGYEDSTHSQNAHLAECNGLTNGLQGLAASSWMTGSATRGEVAQVLHNLLALLGPADTTTTTVGAGTTTTTEAPGGVLARYSGSGDDVLDILKPQGPALVWIRGNAGSDYFGVTSYGPGSGGQYTYYELLANETDPYEGIRLIDYYQGYSENPPQTTRIQVKAEGAWQIEIRSLSTARIVGTPGTIQGTGDDVIRVSGSPGEAHIVGNAASRYFGVTAYYGPTSLYDLLVNDTDPYEGTVMFSKANVQLLEVQAADSWSISTMQ